MTSNTAAQLAILADALTEIVDLASGGPKLVAPSVELNCWRGQGISRRKP